MEGGKDDGGSIGPFGYDHSYSDTSDVQTIGLSLGSTDISAEGHHTDTYTVDISGKVSEGIKQIGEAYEDYKVQLEDDKVQLEYDTNKYIEDQVNKALPNGAK